LSIAVVADAHLGGPGGPAEPLVAQLAELPQQGCKRLVLLGDLFQVWVGSDKYETDDVRAVQAALIDLRNQGVQLDYVEGNRDFFIGEGPYRSLFDTFSTEVSFDIAGRSYLAVHGDGLNDRDRQYLFWRWLSKSMLSRFIMLNLPAGLAQRAVGVTESQLGKTNFQHRMKVPEDAIRQYATRRFKEGFDVLLLGHFHEPQRWREGEGEIQLLDAWFRTRQVEWFGREA
jgi:UDP-2,3-diacylglucosamine hydrolase